MRSYDLPNCFGIFEIPFSSSSKTRNWEFSWIYSFWQQQWLTTSLTLNQADRKRTMRRKTSACGGSPLAPGEAETYKSSNLSDWKTCSNRSLKSQIQTQLTSCDLQIVNHNVYISYESAEIVIGANQPGKCRAFVQLELALVSTRLGRTKKLNQLNTESFLEKRMASLARKNTELWFFRNLCPV